MSFVWRRMGNPLLPICALKPKSIPISERHIKVNEVNLRNASTLRVVNNLSPKQSYYSVFRHKSKKAKYDSDDEQENFSDNTDVSLNKDSKVIKFNTTSMRTDIILKSALSVARNKIEQQFYESKIRVNGRKILKKSTPVRIGDEVDIIKMVSPKNPEHLYVSRIEILSVAAEEENIKVTARRFKNLLIENYETDPYKGNPNANSS